jgi:hypothetical protein
MKLNRDGQIISIESTSARMKHARMKEHVELLKKEGLPVPPNNPDPRIIVQNEKKLAVA